MAVPNAQNDENPPYIQKAQLPNTGGLFWATGLASASRLCFSPFPCARFSGRTFTSPPLSRVTVQRCLASDQRWRAVGGGKGRGPEDPTNQATRTAAGRPCDRPRGVESFGEKTGGNRFASGLMPQAGGIAFFSMDAGTPTPQKQTRRNPENQAMVHHKLNSFNLLLGKHVTKSASKYSEEACGPSATCQLS